MRNLSWSIVILVSLSLHAAVQTVGQEQKGWTWKDRKGNIKSRADLDEVLKLHRAYMAGSLHGVQADLDGAELIGADLNGENLSHAILTRATLQGADLTNANLTHAYLGAATLSGAKLSRAHLQRADLRDADLESADISNSDLTSARLTRARLGGTNLRNAGLGDVDLTGADLSGANLSNAELSMANLEDTLLVGTDLGGATLFGARLRGAVFEPKDLPLLVSVSGTSGLEFLTYQINPWPLTQLRKQFQDAGFRYQERSITYALNRGQAKYGFRIEYWFKRIAFDLTCQYGLSPGRPLKIVILLWFAFSIMYVGFIHSDGESGIYFIGTRVWRGRSNTQGIRICPGTIPKSRKWETPFLWLGREWRVWRVAMFFSLMSAFNIGFRDINFGRWLRLLTHHEYDLRAAGWARTCSGIQSLLSVYLIALWVLTYFGRPFG